MPEQLRSRVGSRGATWDNFSGQYYPIFDNIIFCFVVAICDLVHAVETMYGFLKC